MKTTWLITLIVFQLISKSGITSQFDSKVREKLSFESFREVAIKIAYYPIFSFINFLIIAFVWVYGAPTKIGIYDTHNYSIMTQQAVLTLMLVTVFIDLFALSLNLKSTSRKKLATITLALWDILIFILYVSLFSKDLTQIMTRGFLDATW